MDAEQTATLLGFANHDVQILIRQKLLQPLGKPAPNAPKWFAACTIEQLRQDLKWLNAASKAVSIYWRNKRERLTPKAPTANNAPPQHSVP